MLEAEALLEESSEVKLQARVDGKDLALARFPLTLELTVHGRDGDSAVASLVVEK